MANSTENHSIEDMTQELSDSIMSPFCPGRTLSACPSEDARQLRFQISNSLSQGYSKEAVIRQLSAKYGPELSGLPGESDFGKLASVIPYYFLLAGVIIVFISIIVLRKKSRFSKEEDFSDKNLEDIKLIIKE